MKDLIRTVIFRPYLKGQGPTFRLSLYDIGLRRTDGKEAVGYKFTMKLLAGKSVTVFEGSDIGCSPLHAIDSDATVKSVMTFITLRPGDTDAEYFQDYNAEQRAFVEDHAESLDCAVFSRFGE